MRKFLIAFLIVFVAHVGCKKMDVGGDTLCGCSPVSPPSLNLIIKNSAGQDLLDEKTANAFTKETIQVYRYDETGKVVQLPFLIRPPFKYGDQSFANYLLSLPALFFESVSASPKTYLKLGNQEPYEVELLTENNNQKISGKVFINKQEIPGEKTTTNGFVPIFYLTVN